jgi:hypothetical protein
MSRLAIVVSFLCLAVPKAYAQNAEIPEAQPAEQQQPSAPVPAEATTAGAAGLPSDVDHVGPQHALAAPAAIPDETLASGSPLLSTADLEALGLDTAQSGVDTSLNISGFADFTFAEQFGSQSSLWRASGSAPGHSSFYIGSFNLYVRKNLTDTLRTLGEVRFSYLPNGSADPLARTLSSTQVRDYSDFGRNVRWGSILIQRLYLEWTAHPLFTLRAGQFLTPYGIWNVDHGTPTYIPIQRPFVVGLDWFPERQTGLELFGRVDVSSYGTVGYHVTLSNGTGPVSEFQDLDDNKALGGRLYFEYRALGELRLGASAYYGRDTQSVPGYVLQPDGAVTSQERLNAQFDALAWAADVSWKYQGWQLQSEWISYQRAYTTRGRTAMNVMGGAQVPGDSFSWGMYGLAGYRFRWFGIMPFVVVEHIDGQLETNRLSNITFQGGINARPVDSLTLKLGYYHVQFFHGITFGKAPLNMLQAQAAWTF